jgi:hypothetical protein
MSEFSDYDAVLKTFYNGQMIQDLTNTDNPTIALIGREKLAGSTMPLPVIDSYGQGVSASFSTAKTNQTNGVEKKFTLQATTLYQVVNIDRLTWKSSQGSSAAFMDYMKFKIDGGLQGVGNAMAAYMFGTGTGVLATNNAISTGVITLSDPDTVTFFEPGQVLQATTTNDASSNANARAAKGYVIAVDYNAGTITVSATAGGAAGTPTGWVATDFLGLDGTLNAVPAGLPGWIPQVAPGSTTFKNVDRSSDVARLAGSRSDQSGVTVEEAFLNASSILARMGKKPDCAFVSTDVYNQLQKVLQGRVIFVETQVGSVGFEGLKVNGAKGPIRVYQDRNCPQQNGWLVTTNSWGIYSVGPAPELQTDDFGRLLRRADADAYQAVISGYWDIGCNAPVANCAIKFAAQ